MDKRPHYLNLVWQERIHVSAGTFAALPSEAQTRYATVWGLAQAMLAVMVPLPVGLLRWWLQQPRGHIVVDVTREAYIPGSQTWNKSAYESVLYIRAEHLASDQLAFIALARLLDHLMGSAARETGPLFSSGCGATPDLADAARRFQAIEALGYGHAELDADSAAAYLARSLWLATHDPQELNRIDPLLDKLYRQTLLDEEFWSCQP